MDKNKKDLESVDYELSKADISILDELPDDEAILEIDKLIGKNDKLIEKDYLSSLVEQEDRMIFYEVENIYKNYSSRRYRNKFNLRKDPPILVMRDDLGNEAEFMMTENLVKEMESTIKEIRRAYLGYSGPEDLLMPDELIDKVKYYTKNNPLKVLFPIALITFIVLFSILQ